MHFSRPSLPKPRGKSIHGLRLPSTSAAMGFLHHYEQAMPARMRNDMVATLAEFVGTFLWLLFAFAIAQIANMVPEGDTEPIIPTTLRVFYIALGFSVSLAIVCWLFYRVSGGMFNPAVTLTLYLVGAVPGLRSIYMMVAQLIAGIAAAGMTSLLFPGPMYVDLKLGAGTSISQGVFIEMFTTILLVFTVVMLAAVKHKATFLAPLGIGMALFVDHLTAVYFTGAGMNPARAFGPAVINHSFPGYHWIYWVGPLLGSLVAASFYHVLEFFDWKAANPGQDFDDLEAAAVDAAKHATPRSKVYPAATGCMSGSVDAIQEKEAAAEQGRNSAASAADTLAEV